MLNKIVSMLRNFQTSEAPVSDGYRPMEVAIVGMACRFPGAEDYTQFWDNLRAGRDSVGEIPPERWDWRAFWGDSVVEPGKTRAKHAGCIDNVADFDPLFFGISRASAEMIDPQQRIMLELSWACFEDAGIPPSRLAGSRMGVFLGAFNHDYKERQERMALPIDEHRSTGVAASVIANRISHFYDLRGPSIVLDTACSGSLNAIHLAVQSLRLGESEMALAGGISLLLTPTRHVAFAKTGMLSPSGACKSFDDTADGYVRSEGAGVLLLKPLARALADGDMIHGVIRGSAANHCGKTHTLTYPSAEAQAEVIRTALKDAEIDAGTVSHIEAHGTGTPKGDPIEIEGLCRAFSDDAARQTGYCAIGSAKSNIGHLESAAGVAGAIKVLLSMKARQLPPLCHFSTVNHRIRLDGSPFYLLDRLQTWQGVVDPHSGRRVLRAGVSSFGFGGTNAHLILEEAPERVESGRSAPARPAYLICLSAKSEESLRRYQTALADWLDDMGQDVHLEDIGAVLALGREHMRCRLAVTVGSKEALAARLREPMAVSLLPAAGVDNEAERRGNDALARDIVEMLAQAEHDPVAYTCRLEHLAVCYRNGATVDFAALFTMPARHVVLPGYRFARERCWLPGDVQPVTAGVGWLPRWVEDGQRGSYIATFQPDEPLVRDHVVHGQRWLAGALQLECMRAAFVERGGCSSSWSVSDVTWMRPLVVAEQALDVRLQIGEAGDFSIADARWEEDETACRGRIGPGSGESLGERLDLAALRARHMDDAQETERIYERLLGAGLAYDAPYRAIVGLAFDGEASVLARVVSATTMHEDLTLNPAAIDAAFQVALMLAMRQGGDAPWVGFALSRFDCVSALPAAFWVHVVPRGSVTEASLAFDIDLIAEDGTRVGRVGAFQLKRRHGSDDVAPRHGDEEISGLMQVDWVPLLPSDTTTPTFANGRMAMIGGDEASRDGVRRLYGDVAFLDIDASHDVDRVSQALAEAGPIERLLWLAPSSPTVFDGAASLVQAQADGVLALLTVVKSLLALGYGGCRLDVCVVTSGALPIRTGERRVPAHAAVHGLVGTLANEQPGWTARAVDVEAESALPLTQLLSLPSDVRGGSYAWRDGVLLRQTLLPVTMDGNAAGENMYRPGGVYVIIGGAGGIGAAWSETLIREWGAQIYWIGRRASDSTIEANIERLARFGPAPVYLRADAGDPLTLGAALSAIRQHHGAVNGVIHAAMALQSRSLERITHDEFRELLATKVDTCVSLAEVFADEPLDFVALFSSINAFMCVPNQGAYAAGCAFVDAFGRYLESRFACPVAVVNWGYWGSVGALAASEVFQAWRAREDLASVELPDAMAALSFQLTYALKQVALAGPLSAPSLLASREERIVVNAAHATDAPLNIPHRPIDVAQARGGLTTPDLDPLYCRLLQVKLCASGLWSELRPYSLDELAGTLAPGVTTRRWLAHSLELLERQGLVRREGDGEATRYVLAHRESAEAVWAEWARAKALWLADPDRRAQVALVDACLDALPAVLSGRTRATDVMFPDASMARVEGIYQRNAVSDYFNDAVADTVWAQVSARRASGGRALRVLEIGAGTGGTSARVLARLDAARDWVEEYCYSDVSRAFLLHAEEHYGEGRPYLSYRLVDAEQDLPSQGIETGRYDVVLATNVLHATRDIRATVRHVKAALARGGLLVLNELHGASVFSHLTFGLLEGWWKYEDAALREAGSPGLTARMWQQVLEDEGFGAVKFVCVGAHGLGQQVIVAKSDGLARVRRGKPTTQEAVKARRAEPERTVEAPASDEGTRRESIRQAILEVLAHSLKFDASALRFDEPFADYGVDSITGVNFVRQLNGRLGIELYVTCLFDYSTIDRLSEYIAQQYQYPAACALASTLGPDQDVARIADILRQEAAPVARAPDDDAIAIVGASGRFAQSRNLNELWRHLAEGHDLVDDVKRWDLAAYYPDVASDDYCSRGAFIDGIEEFDPLFFNISPLEATYMDPQQRLFLQEAWNALADAGCLGERQRTQVSVYVGCEAGDYDKLFVNTPPAQAFWGNAPSIVPARIAYYLDLQGPAIAVDTACSSSLVAIHMACQSLRSGEASISLAGGVFVQSTPDFYLKANRAGMLSKTGHCHTFDSRADGFVPGEGVGVVVMKRLADAIADRDHIYGVIRASGINQDGASNGITAPSALSQQRLEQSVYDRFAIDPASIQMVEAHGTGTRLGDPIEFAALSAAFNHYTDKRGYCALGSVKTNLGHAATAAGMAGVFKILLALRHRMIPPSLHFSEANPTIDFAASPFYLNTSLRDWQTAPGEKRRAAISSFGFSGTNAHLVVEEASNSQRAPSSTQACLIALSGHSAAALYSQAELLLDFCRATPAQPLLDLSFSTLTGRKHFEYRLALLASSIDELSAALETWLRTGHAAHCWSSADARAISSRQEERAECAQWTQMAERYCQGQQIDFSRMFDGLECRRLPLPGYPFARDRYWVEDLRADWRPSDRTAPSHPLLVETADADSFYARFDGDEYFLSQHRVVGRRVMPGVAMLEMAAAAARRRRTNADDKAISLEHVAWIAPLAVEAQPVEATLALEPRADGEWTFEIRRAQACAESEIYCLGSLTPAPAEAPCRLDLGALAAGCTLVERSSADCYRHFAAVGIDYGDAFRRLVHWSAGQDAEGRRQVLARIESQRDVEHGLVGWWLEPGMVDAALQAAVQLWAVDAARPVAWVPFAVERVDIFGRCAPRMWAHVLEHSVPENGASAKVDIVLADDAGDIRLMLCGLTFRVMAQGTTGETSLWAREWRPLPTRREDAPPVADRLIVAALGEAPARLANTLPGVPYLAPFSGEADYELAGLRLMQALQAVVAAKSGRPTRVQVLTRAGDKTMGAGLYSMVASVTLENPGVLAQLVEVDDAALAAGIEHRLLDEAFAMPQVRLSWRDGVWRRGCWQRLTAARAALPWSAGGVYLITGGSGGIGRILVEEIVRKVERPVIVLVGRSAAADWIEAIARHATVEYWQADVADFAAVERLVAGIIERHGTLTGIVHAAGVLDDGYLLTKRQEALRRVFAPKVQGTLNLDRASRHLPLEFFVLASSISAELGNAGQANYAAANGFMDAFARYRAMQTERGERHGRTLAVNWPFWREGGMRIDTAGLSRLFDNWGMTPMGRDSGVAALYTAMAQKEEAQVLVMHGDPVRVQALLARDETPASLGDLPGQDGETLTLPVVLAQAALLAGVEARDLDPYQPFHEYGFDWSLQHELIRVLSHHHARDLPVSIFLLSTCLAQVADALSAELSSDPRDPAVLESSPPMNQHVTAIDPAAEWSITNLLKDLVSSVTRVPRAELKDDCHFERYGLDSLMVVQMTGQLEKQFGPLSKTLFFEYTTIAELAGYFLERHGETVQRLNRGAEPNDAAVREEAPALVNALRVPDEPRVDRPAAAAAAEAIAIVGLAGRYPQAENLDAFWRNLAEGHDCITEVPLQRWDHAPLFDSERARAGKINSKWGGFIDGVDEFDPLFFNISPHDAEFMDPQERLFLQCAYETFEDAGYGRGPRSALGDAKGLGHVGVFVGVMYLEYQLYGAQELSRGNPLALGGSAASIANRVSFCLGLNGPSLAVDSMCSASLTAIHLACQAIRNGDCDSALAGGVNLTLHPNKYLTLAQGNFASSKGLCESFGEGGDGYVPGEGVGAILLKPLDRALADGDQIYGIVRGSQINHGGRANGYTVPNPNAQAEVIGVAYRRAGIDVRDITYLEAHGTGTALGDPIEIAGLEKVFRAATDEKGFCALGSVKSNIGHCESAAGIAGLTKVLLQMKYGELVPSLHSRTLNPAIDFSLSPFVVQQARAPWHRRRVKDTAREKPRLAGISSFGAGGSNAHLVIEEYLPADETPAAHAARMPALIVLSAASKEGLKELARRHLEFARDMRQDAASLVDLAFTLQRGREPLKERLAFVAHSVDELRRKFGDFLEGRDDTGALYSGSTRQGGQSVLSLFDTVDMALILKQWVAARQYDKLLALWTQGATIDWQDVLPDSGCRRISLPTYPFARERYWFTGIERISKGQSVMPVVERRGFDLIDLSNARGTRFAVDLSGREFFFEDHVVRGQRMLPGVVYLELARQAAEMRGLASGVAVKLCDVAWLRPTVAREGGLRLEIDLDARDDDGVDFTISEVAVHAAEGETLRASGTIRFADARCVPAFDADALIGQLQGQGESYSFVSQAEFYAQLAEHGLAYGPAHRSITALHIGRDAVLARIECPIEASMDIGAFDLHPSMMDAALQAVHPLLSVGDGGFAVPFVVDEVVVHGASLEHMWAFVRRGAESGQGFVVDLFGDDGEACVSLAGFKVRAFGVRASAQTVEDVELLSAGVSSLAPRWSSQALLPEPAQLRGETILLLGSSQEHAASLRAAGASVMVCDLGPASEVEEIVERLSALPAFDRLLISMPVGVATSIADEAMIHDQRLLAVYCLRLAKALLRLGYDRKTLTATILTWGAFAVGGQACAEPAQASVHGFVGSLANEIPHWQLSVVDLINHEMPDWRVLLVPPRGPGLISLAYRQRGWLVRQLVPCQPPEPPAPVYRQGGLYVVIGGAGGIGEAWSRMVIREYGARVVWIGRRQADAALDAKLDDLGQLGPRPVYLAADAANRAALEDARAQILKRFGRIDGLVHSAIVLEDRSVANMSESQFDAGLTAKVDISVRMAQIFGAEPLDFVLFFSSLISFTRNAGQSNYSAGCAFKDAFAERMRQAWPCPVKVMNWGYWGGTGIVASSAYRQRMERAGFGSIEAGEAMGALEELLGGPFDQLAFLKTLRPLGIEGCVPGERIVVAQAIPGDTSATLAAHGADVVERDWNLALLLQREEAFRAMSESLYCRLLQVKLCASGLWSELRPYSLDELAGTLAPGVTTRRWLAHSLELLERQGLVRREGDGEATRYVLAHRESAEAVWAEWARAKALWLADPDRRAQVALVDACLDALPAVLSGRTRATDVMFPDASMARVEGIYQRNAVSDYFNDAVADTVWAQVSARRASGGRALRVLEIGAGTGGTSARVLARLDAARDWVEEYCYSDVSRAFLLHAEEHYGEGRPYLSYRLVDAEQDLPSQGIETGRYDVVLATNVLHATRDIRATVRHVKAALARGGLLVLNELHGASVFSHLTFGLLEGWWKYEDAALREAGSPGLTARMWQQVLEDEGFGAVKFVCVGAHGLGQQVIVAKSDGLARVRRGKPTTQEAVKARRAEPERIVEASVREVQAGAKPGRIRQVVSSSVAQALKVAVEAIDPDEAFADYGLDSITGVNLVRVLNEVLGIDLSTTALFDYGTVNKLAAHIAKEHAPQVDAHSSSLATSQSAPLARVQAEPAVEMLTGDIRSGAKPSEIRQVVIASVAKALKVASEVVDPDEAFADYGLDSITGVNLVRVLNEALGIDLSTTALFDYGTVSKLTAHIAKEHAPLVAARTPAPLVKAQAAPEPIAAEQAPPIFTSALAATLASPIAVTREPIAIIGVSGRFPQSASLDELWRNLASGMDVTTEVSRWDLSRHESERPAEHMRCPRGGFLADIDAFDPLFFNISGLEATCMDPQQRLFLEESWKALEDAGYVAEAIAGRKVGIYVGCSAGDYRGQFAATPPAQAFWGNATSIVPARIAYFLDLQGPAIAVDTACSSSLVAVHLACQALWSGEVEMALAGGVFVQATPSFHLSSERAGMLSPSGRCHAFDARADGFVPSEGVGVVILKRLSAALADGDHVHAVIRGSGINQDGASNGITAPSAKSQANLIEQVHRDFAVRADEIQLVEAHGTGTPLGDPIEFEGLARAFRAASTDRRASCALGSIKSNIGHAVTAAGVAGLLKLVLALRHGQIPPVANFKAGNPRIDFEGSPFYLNTELSDWRVDGMPRCAALSSFGFSGTNAHLVLQEAPGIPSKPGVLVPRLFVLSARSSDQLRQQVRNLSDACRANPAADPASMSYTLLAGRKHFEYRLAIVAESEAELLARLEGWLVDGEVSQAVFAGHYLARHFEASKEGLDELNAHCTHYRRESGHASQVNCLAALASLYVQGYHIDPPALFAPDDRRRMPLPTYPFERQAYWATAMASAAASGVPYDVESDTVAALASPVLTHSTASEAGNWLFCAERWSDAPLLENLDWQERVRLQAGRTLAVFAAERSEGDDFCDLIGQVWRRVGMTPPRIELFVADGWDGGALAAVMPDVAFFLGARGDGNSREALADMSTIFKVSREIMQSAWEHPLDCYYLYDAARAESEAVTGFAASAVQENRHHAWTVVEHQADASALPHQVLLQEWLGYESRPGQSMIVRYGAGGRQTRDLVKVPSPLPCKSGFRHGGHYLVVGGLGPVGELLCRELVRTCQATLVILSRTAMNDAIRGQCDALKSYGGRVFYHEVDVNDAKALQVTMETVARQVGELHGVIHLARLVDDGLIAGKTWESFRKTVAAKVDGTRNLDHLTAQQPLDFFMVFSSMAAFGLRGGADYSYATAFQNAFMRERARLRTKGLRQGASVAHCWGAWSVDRYMPANRTMRLEECGLDVIDIEAAFPVLHACGVDGVYGVLRVIDEARAMRNMGISEPDAPRQDDAPSQVSLRRLIVRWEEAYRQGRPVDPATYYEALNGCDLAALDDELVDRLDLLLFAEEGGELDWSNTPVVHGGAKTVPEEVVDTETLIQQMVSKVLLVPKLDLDDVFQRFGLDSVAAMQLASGMSHRLGYIVEPKWLLQYSTIRRLAAHLNAKRILTQQGG
ncbi:SDR family NAD(P)-dependent oxidoreductase [Chromobacterium sp. IIBBL 290-4]|uniref:SDR family NAD(P)-dependent oxidoreductase n=1 Tax=Chromobacterium sp. IIBBL 290-4 TaxID=2953890 RepID=UPI0020B6CE5C|nr:SDR family NAD(P)-dependent oxidoreductase [Chromobacterium sp. IIBBL 290-4]UTH76435.1 SDR family NAD(P)-dependent oxidoreductase [Chromobacterium sp. IIBBL 290-4]